MQSSQTAEFLLLCSATESIRTRSAMKTCLGNHVESEDKGAEKKEDCGKGKRERFPK
jgi:hypothetical protein